MHNYWSKVIYDHLYGLGELDREATALEIANRIGISRRSAEKHMRDLKKVLNYSWVSISTETLKVRYGLLQEWIVLLRMPEIEKETKRIQRKNKNLNADIHTVYLQTGKRMHA